MASEAKFSVGQHVKVVCIDDPLFDDELDYVGRKGVVKRWFRATFGTPDPIYVVCFDDEGMKNFEEYEIEVINDE